MALEGTGLLALWNGFAPERADEYDLWHTREHLPARLGVPGMLGARRYVDGDGPLPGFLTLYELTSTAVLTGRPYLDLLGNPTPWSRSMRPSFRDFLRLGCRVELSQGGGIGGALLATTLAVGDLATSSPGFTSLARLLALPAITAVHLARVDPAIPPAPFGAPGATAGLPADAALFVEGYDRAALAAARADLAAALAAAGVTPARPAWTSYALAYALRRGDLDAVIAYAPAERSAGT